MYHASRHNIMPSQDTKIQATNYLLKELLKWQGDKLGNSENMDLLKFIKLNFFVASVGISENTDDTLLDLAFDNFYALPYGHVESDIYELIKQDKLDIFTLEDQNIVYKNRDAIESTDSLDENIKLKIGNGIQLLNEKNEDIIAYKPFDLVEISHRYYSWRFYYGQAQAENRLRKEIPKEEIKTEPKVYYK